MYCTVERAVEEPCECFEVGTRTEADTVSSNADFGAADVYTAVKSLGDAKGGQNHITNLVVILRPFAMSRGVQCQRASVFSVNSQDTLNHVCLQRRT